MLAQGVDIDPQRSMGVDITLIENSGSDATCGYTSYGNGSVNEILGSNTDLILG